MKRMSITKQQHMKYVRCHGGDSSETNTLLKAIHTLSQQNPRHRPDLHTNRKLLNHWGGSTRKKTGFLKLKILRNFSRHHALYHPAVLYSVHLKVKVRLTTLRA